MSIGSLTAVLNLIIARAPIVPSVIIRFDCRHKIIVAIKNGITVIPVWKALLYRALCESLEYTKYSYTDKIRVTNITLKIVSIDIIASFVKKEFTPQLQ